MMCFQAVVVFVPVSVNHVYIVTCIETHFSPVTCQLGGGGGGGPTAPGLSGRGGGPAGGSVCLPLLIFPCPIKSRSSLLAPAACGPGKRAVKRLRLWHLSVDYDTHSERTALYEPIKGGAKVGRLAILWSKKCQMHKVVGPEND